MDTHGTNNLVTQSRGFLPVAAQKQMGRAGGEWEGEHSTKRASPFESRD